MQSSQVRTRVAGPALALGAARCRNSAAGQGGLGEAGAGIAEMRLKSGNPSLSVHREMQVGFGFFPETPLCSAQPSSVVTELGCVTHQGLWAGSVWEQKYHQYSSG